MHWVESRSGGSREVDTAHLQGWTLRAISAHLAPGSEAMWAGDLALALLHHLLTLLAVAYALHALVVEKPVRRDFLVGETFLRMTPP